jgi:hypothetical protein
MKALCPVIVVRSSVQNPAKPSHVINGSFSQHRLSCAGAERQEPLPLPTHQKRLGYAQPFGPLLAVDPAGTAASGLLLQAFYTVPEQYQQVAGRSMRALSRLADVAGF